MTEVRYVAAASADAWRAAVGAEAIAVLAPSVTPQTAEAVWRRLGGGGIGALVEALTGAFGTSLTAIPPFALVVVEGGDVRVAVRGAIEVVVETDDDAHAISGRGVATWAERLFPRAVRVTVSVEGDTDDAEALPVVSGVVPVRGLVLSLGAATAVPAAAAVPATSAAPAAAAAPAAPAAAATAPAPAAPVSAADAPEPTPPAPEAHDDPAPASDTWIPADSEAHPAEPTASGAEPAGSGLVDSVPFGLRESVADDRTVAVPRPARSTPPATPWTATVVRESTPADAGPADTTAGWPADGDHDGATISVAEARAMRGESASFEPVADVPARQPSRGRVRLSSGQAIELERPVIIGRRPRSTRASGADLPTLVAVESPEGDISRSHVEIRAEGEHVLVVDLATTNGTVLKRSGHDPVRLHPNEPTMVVTGDVLDLGDGVTVTFEDLP